MCEFNWEIMLCSEYAPFLDGRKFHDLEQEAEVGEIVDHINALETLQWEKEVYRDLTSIKSKADLTSIENVFSFHKQHKPLNRTKSTTRRENKDLARLEKDLLGSVGNLGARELTKAHAIKVKEYLLVGTI